MAKEKADRRLLAPQKKDGTFDFTYTPSHSTDVRKTFERIRAEQDQQRAIKNVTSITRKR